MQPWLMHQEHTHRIRPLIMQLGIKPRRITVHRTTEQAIILRLTTKLLSITASLPATRWHMQNQLRDNHRKRLKLLLIKYRNSLPKRRREALSRV